VRANAQNRNEFARSLPQEILSELVITMSDLPATPAFTPRAAVKHAIIHNGEASDVDHLQQARPPAKRARKSAGDALMIVPDGDYDVKQSSRSLRASLSQPPCKRSRRNIEPAFPSPKKMPTSRPQGDGLLPGLIDRMIQGPGFWTRLVGPSSTPSIPDR